MLLKQIYLQRTLSARTVPGTALFQVGSNVSPHFNKHIARGRQQKSQTLSLCDSD